MDPLPAVPPPVPLQIGDWCLDPLAHELRRGDVRRRLPKRLVQLLLALAAAPGTTRTREALLAAAWQRRVVGDEVLSRAIAQLRQALDDDARAPRYIETLPKTGYRLLVPVSTLPAPAATTGAGHARAVRAQPAVRRRAVAGAALTALCALAAGSWHLLHRPPAWTPAAMVHARPFLSEPEWVRQPRVSRDGRLLVFVSDAGSGIDGSVRVMLSDDDGAGARQLDVGPGRPAGPVLSPDATQLAVLARLDGRCEVRVVALPAGSARNVAMCDLRHGANVEWMPDGRLLYTAAPQTGGGSGLWLVDPASGAREQVTRPTRAEVADVAPRRGNDDRIAFLRGPNQRQRIVLRDDAGERVLVASEDRVTDLAWTPDARHLIVASNRSGYPALHRLDPRDGSMLELGGRSAGSLDIAPDGRLLFEQRRYTANLQRHRDGAPVQQLSHSSRYDAWPALAPDGSRLAYLSNRDGNGTVHVLDLQTQASRRLDLPDDQGWLRPAWSPDGRQLLLTRYADGDSNAPEAWRYSVDSGLLETFAPSRAFAPQALDDGSHVFALPADAGKRLWLQRADGTRELLDENVGEFRADGMHVAWQVRGEPGVRLRTVHAARVTTLLGELDRSQPATWTLAGGGIVFLAPGPDAVAHLWRQPLDGRPATPWLPVDGAAADSTVAVAADHSFAVLAGIGRIEAALLQVPAPAR